MKFEISMSGTMKSSLAFFSDLRLWFGRQVNLLSLPGREGIVFLGDGSGSGNEITLDSWLYPLKRITLFGHVAQAFGRRGYHHWQLLKATKGHLP